MKLFVIGTSHITDRHHYQDWHNDDCKNGYVDHDNDKCLPFYIADKLNCSVVDASLGSLGIDTYPSRIVAHGTDFDIALIEFPTTDRFELYLNETNPGDSLHYDFWSDHVSEADVDHHFKDYVYRYNSADIEVKYPFAMDKAMQVNHDTDIPVTNNELITLANMIPKYNDTLLSDAVYAKSKMINSYFNDMNIIPIWFSWGFPIQDYDMSEFTCVNSQIDNMSFRDFCLQGKYPKTTYNFPDGCHLRSDAWRDLVDTYFIEFMKKYMK